jgi:opacity protein-like surface antigen
VIQEGAIVTRIRFARASIGFGISGSGLAPLVAALLACFALPASAADTTGFYVGAGIASGRYDFEIPPYSFLPIFQPTPRLSESRWAPIFLVGARPWRLVGFEVGYAGWGERFTRQSDIAVAAAGTLRVRPPGPIPPPILGQTTHARIKTGTAAAVAFLPWGAFEGFAKAGVAYHESVIKADLQFTCPPGYLCIDIPGSQEQTRHATNMMLGAGLQWHVQRLAIRAEHERLQIEHGVSLSALEVVWTF